MFDLLYRIWNAIVDWIDERIGIREIGRSQLTEYPVPKSLNFWHSLGGLAIFIFTIQVATGIFLLMYYIPHPDKAFESVLKITEEIPYGWLYRRIHAIGASGMVLVVILHLLSVVYYGSYKKPRELNWLTGIGLLKVTLIVCLTGYLLPWSQLSYWATVVATNVPSAVPVIGHDLVTFIRGSEDVGAITLNRFFALHVAAFPMILGLLVAVHLFILRRTGIAEPSEPDDRKGEE